MKMGSIGFTLAMAKAERDGLKTQTRRPLNKPIPELGSPKPRYTSSGNLVFDWQLSDQFTEHLAIPCPFGQPGDLLYVKEPAWMWCEKIPNGTTPTGRQKYLYRPLESAPVLYQADHPKKPATSVVSPDTGNEWCWRLKIGRFLPRWASRTTLEITGVRLERLQEISREDAMAEGIERSDWPHSIEPYRNYLHPRMSPGHNKSDPRASFMTLWQSLYGEASWSSNSWVWVYQFKSHRMQVDELIYRRAWA